MIIATNAFPPIAMVNGIPLPRPDVPTELDDERERHLVAIGWATYVTEQAEEPKPTVKGKKRSAEVSTNADVS